MPLPPRVLPITPGRTSDGDLSLLQRQLVALHSGGAAGVLIREPALSDGAALELARFARDLFSGGWLGVHDRIHVAKASGADAVHLGFRSLPPLAAKTACPGLTVGHSQHFAQMQDSEMDPDYRFLGPVYATPSKAGLVEPFGVDALTSLPMASRTWAIGGIGPDEAPRVLAAGVGGVACIGAVFSGGEVKSAMREILDAVSVHGGAL